MSVLGSAIQVALYDEVTYKSTTSVTKGMLAYYTECSLAASRNNIQPNTISSDRSRPRPGVGNYDVSGNLNIEMAPQHIGFFLRHVLGAPTTTGTGEPAEAPYTHTFRPKALPVGLIVERDWTDVIASKVEHFLGCRVAQATIDIPQEGAATLQMQLNGAKYAIASAVLDGTLTDPGHTGWFAPDCVVNVGGSAVTNLKSVQFTIANNMDTGRYAIGGGGERMDLPEGFADVSGSVTAIVDTALFSAYLDKAIARTDTALEVVLTFGTGTGATAGNEKLSIKLDHAQIELSTPPINSPGGMEVSFNFTGYKSGATDKGLVAVLLSPLADTVIA
jgi:hypothetical protein